MVALSHCFTAKMKTDDKKSGETLQHRLLGWQHTVTAVKGAKVLQRAFSGDWLTFLPS